MLDSKTLSEVTVIVPWQASEAVESFLMDSGALGTSIERFGSESLKETVRAYFPGDRPLGELEASVAAYLKAIEDQFPSAEEWPFSGHFLAEGQWQEKWKAFFKPVRVGRRIVIKPSWEPYQAREREIIITLDPGMAFGTGHHATTRLCLEGIEAQIDRKLKQPRKGNVVGVSLLDVGTGSGILAIVAAKLGARPVVAIDKDKTAIDVARQNVRRNQVDDAVRISSRALEGIDGCFDLVVANIDLPTLAELMAPLKRHVSERGQLVLSGITREQSQGLRNMARPGEFRLIKERGRQGWRCLVFQRSSLS